MKTKRADGGSYMGRVVFRVLLEIVLVGDKSLTEISRLEVIFCVLSCIASSGLGVKIKVMLRCVSEYDCGSCVFCLGLTILVGILTNWVVADVSVCDAFCAEVLEWYTHCIVFIYIECHIVVTFFILTFRHTFFIISVIFIIVIVRKYILLFLRILFVTIRSIVIMKIVFCN